MKSLFYLQSGFWEKLQSDTSRDGIRAQFEVSDALLFNSRVITDISPEAIESDDLLKVIFKQTNIQPCKAEYFEKKLSELKETPDDADDDLMAIFMLNMKSCECDVIEEKYGVLALCADSLPKRRYLFTGDGFSMDNKHHYSQRYLTFQGQLNRPCNSMIIIDPYLLKERVEDKTNKTVSFPGIANNLESLLDALLPHQLEIPFHLTIVSSLDDPHDIKKVYEKTKKCVRRIRQKLDVKLGFVYTATGYSHLIESFHSRHVISNNFCVDSEEGLDLFNEKGFLTKNNPTVSIVFPKLLGNSRQDFTKYEKWINSVKNRIGDSKLMYPEMIENRLLKSV